MIEDFGEKLGYIQAKLETIHEDLTNHITDEGGRFDSLERRIDTIETTHASWKTVYNTIKVTVLGLVAIAAYQWSALLDNFKSFFKH